MAPAKLHHTVPRFYLAGFADGKLITTVRVADRTSFPQSVSTASAENGFYAVDSEDGPDSFEKALSALESDAATVLASARDGLWPLPDEDRYVVAYFLAVQALRGRSHRQMMDENATNLIRHAVATAGEEAFRARLGDDAEGLTSAQLEEAFLIATTAGRFRVRFPAEAHIQQIAELADDVAGMLSIRPWNLVRFSDPAFLTSDRPVGLVRDSEMAWLPPGYATAVGVTFPVDRFTGLIMGPPEPSAAKGSMDISMEGSKRHQELVNAHALGNAHEQIYHHPDDSVFLRE